MSTLAVKRNESDSACASIRCEPNGMGMRFIKNFGVEKIMTIMSIDDLRL